ncbi:minor extracellular serine protease Vpr [Gracilibacillus halotolerans]|uniref:Minor extracellular serine protease Vpr n=1 Tax=Gracilibacillus halotolerans TaxID=74386 RepID=A0A841RPU4_9BACI|nr:S8 family serine peptidase [Gracilibacillus halotolerans]MBB6513643.1 minor extracellular serine protease Vpr [Gracilibacillus halotolerans]
MMVLLSSMILFFNAITLQEEIPLIIEVEDNPHEIAKNIEAYHPSITILAIYDTVFQGVAIEASPRDLKQLQRTISYKKTYPVREYKTQETNNINNSVPFIMEHVSSHWTGKGVKVGVIDTGVDYTHPDLRLNYRGGYDLVDFDGDPMETTIEEGIPTTHGTHVAGIIAANGQMKGIAPDAELYAYRALGPGGTGTSVQVMAAIEQAVKDGMDVINLSLGNTINGPDWPTSVAVNRATEEGIAVVIANGNSGPNQWTVGSPASADQVISVGASTPPLELPYFYEPFSKKRIDVLPLQGAPPFTLNKANQIIQSPLEDEQLPRNSIVLYERGETPFAEMVLEAQEKGAEAVFIMNNEEGMFQGGVDARVEIPVAAISKEDGEWLKNQPENRYIEQKVEIVQDTVTDFSSRGPVTVNWNIKPDVVAPGASILSTIPGGYDSYNGTSMAAPHVAGVVALLKQAHPDWTVEQLKAALASTATPLDNALPIDQGAGKINVEAAINADTLVYNNFLHFGKVESPLERKKFQVEVENLSDEEMTYRFQHPENDPAIRFYLPASFTLKPNERKKISVEAAIQTNRAQSMEQGYLFLNDIPLPYLLLTEEADIPQAMGLEWGMEPINGTIQYQFYLVENANKITVDLYDARTFAYNGEIITLKDVTQGVIEGELEAEKLPPPGEYIANITIETDKEIFSYQEIFSYYEEEEE